MHKSGVVMQTTAAKLSVSLFGLKIDTSDGLLRGVAELLRQFYPQTWCQTFTAQQIKLIKRRLDSTRIVAIHTIRGEEEGKARQCFGSAFSCLLWCVAHMCVVVVEVVGMEAFIQNLAAYSVALT